VVCIEFRIFSDEWLGFIINCRKGTEVCDDYDIIIGGVANDKVFDTIELYIEGLIDKNTAHNRLRHREPNMQFCFKSSA